MQAEPNFRLSTIRRLSTTSLQIRSTGQQSYRLRLMEYKLYSMTNLDFFYMLQLDEEEFDEDVIKGCQEHEAARIRNYGVPISLVRDLRQNSLRNMNAHGLHQQWPIIISYPISSVTGKPNFPTGYHQTSYNRSYYEILS